MNWFWLALAALSTAMVAYCLITGRVPARWPVPAVLRKDNPASFWFFVGCYALGALVLAGIAFRNIS
ncbi:MAG: hypothetical protein V4574_06535 [Pseudomonadota bacterium]